MATTIVALAVGIALLILTAVVAVAVKAEERRIKKQWEE